MISTIPTRDQAFLELDLPNNPQVVHGLMWFDEEPDWDALQATLQERLLGRFPVFRHRAAKIDGRWVWQEDLEFDLANHVRRTALPAPGGATVAQDYVASSFSERLDPERPLWSLELLTGHTGFGHPHGALLLARVHHAIADGVRIVQVLLGLCDVVDGTSAPRLMGRMGSRRSAAQHAGRLVSDVAEGTVDIATGVGRAALRMPASVRPASLLDRSRLDRSRLARSLSPTKFVHAVSDLAEEKNYAVNTGRSLSRFAVAGRPGGTVLSRPPADQKRISWMTDLDVEVVRDIGRAHGVTINDVCLGLVSRALTDYLHEHGDTGIEELNWFVPVSLKPIDADLPQDLGNHFAIVMPPMPIGIAEPGELLSEISSRMNRIKHSAEPFIGYGVQQIIGLTPPSVSVRVTRLVARKAIGVLTNVPGPRTPLELGGQEVRGMLGFVPTLSSNPISVAIFSYNGRINAGVVTDAGLIPDPERITAAMLAHYHSLSGEREPMPVSV